MTDESARMEELVRVAHAAGRAGLVVATSGNLSVRLSARTFAISGSGARLADLDPEQISVCAVEQDELYEGAEPSIETPMHRAIYRARSDVGAVLHFQSPYATALACAERPSFELDFIPEVPAYLGEIRLVPYEHPGTAELSRAVFERARESDCRLLVLLNHGQVALGPRAPEALRNAEVLEFACGIACRGIPLRQYSADQVRELRDYGKD